MLTPKKIKKVKSKFSESEEISIWDCEIVAHSD